MTGISDLVGKLRSRGARTVALQFPAGLKRRSIAVATALEKEGFLVIISGDPCYGACDISLDLLGYADVLVHFGHTPLVRHPDVIYEPCPVDFDPGIVLKAVPFFSGTTIGLVTTAQHTHMLGESARILRSSGFEVVVRPGDERAPEPGQVLGCSFSAARIPGATDILYIGTGLFHPRGVSLAAGIRVVALDPQSGEVNVVDADRFIRKRHAIVEKSRDASAFGIIVSRKPGQNRYALAQKLTTLGRTAFPIFMDEVSPAELLNLGFPAYVNTACPRLAYDDQVQFPVPVLTPLEFEILCGLRSWDEYRMDEI
ncbi:MAG: diphthamide biosynthesis enzyme Dph2 [Methanoregulaceae archaeon]|nr:diphthamide biosynthesis enzyme Dph2 [Methanoregulaceae archaeon]